MTTRASGAVRNDKEDKGKSDAHSGEHPPLPEEQRLRVTSLRGKTFMVWENAREYTTIPLKVDFESDRGVEGESPEDPSHDAQLNDKIVYRE